MKIREKLVMWATGKLVERYFGGYVCPFGKSSAWLATQTKERKVSYALAARQLLENEVYDREMQEMVRKYYHHLAVDTKSVEEQAAYRLTLSFIKEFQEHVAKVATGVGAVTNGDMGRKLS